MSSAKDAWVLGLAPLSKVTVIAPRSEYEQVVRKLAQFGQFHPAEEGNQRFDPAVQDLAVRAVSLFARADEAVRDLSIPLGPGAIDVVFRGARVPREEVEATDWDDLLTNAEAQLAPIFEKVKADKDELQKAMKEESDVRALRDGLEAVSKLSLDVGAVNKLERVKVSLAVVDNSGLQEFRASLPDLVFLAQALSEKESLVLVASPASDSARVLKVMKALDVKPMSLPGHLPQNPAQAFTQVDKQLQAAAESRAAVEARLAALGKEHQTRLLAVRELAEIAKGTLDQVRTAGGMQRLAVVSGYIPSRMDAEFKSSFDNWMVHSEPARSDHGGGEPVPTLMENAGTFRQFEAITREQGTPGGHEVDPTPLVSFVFPVFFGIMFGDLGHGLVLAAFALLLRARGTGSLRQWGNIFLAAGISACVVGAMVGEFFGFPLYESLHLPGGALLEIVQRSAGQASLSQAGLNVALVISILIGVAHLTTALSLDVVQAVKGHETVELLTEKIPSLTMYIFGVGFGISFIGAKYNFNVMGSTGAAPLLGAPNALVGTVSIAGVVASMLVLLTGKGIAVMTGKLHEGSAGSAFGNGAIEVFERISGYMANTISYVRLAIMLMIHAELLLVVNMLLGFPIFVAAPMMFVFNILIIVFEVLIVYIQDLRLHVYEFFTKFYKGTGTPFRKLLPDRQRVTIKWRSP